MPDEKILVEIWSGLLRRCIPEKFLNARHYVDEVRKVLHSKMGDHTFSRKMGLNITSMLLGIDHQRKFDALMARVDDSPLLKEPFDREVRGKMVSYQKQTLDGFEKFKPLGALSKNNTELLGMYTANKMPVPSSSRRPVERNDRKRRTPANERRSDPRAKQSAPQQRRPRREQRDTQPQTQSRQRLAPTDKQTGHQEVEQRSRPKGEKRTKISRVQRRDLQSIATLAVSNR